MTNKEIEQEGNGLEGIEPEQREPIYNGFDRFGLTEKILGGTGFAVGTATLAKIIYQICKGVEESDNLDLAGMVGMAGLVGSGMIVYGVRSAIREHRKRKDPNYQAPRRIPCEDFKL